MRKKKKKKNKSFFEKKQKGSFITIKTSLKSILKNYDVNFPIINNIVLECNEIVIRTYQFIRLYILYKFYRNEDIPNFDKDTILYFIRACGIRDKRGKKATNKKLEDELNKFYENEFKNCINKSKFNLKNKSYLTPYLAQQIQTSFNNNLKEHFITRIRRFMNITKPDNKLDKNNFCKIKNLILLDKSDKIPEIISKINDLSQPDKDILSRKYIDFSNKIKNNYLPKEYDKCYGYDVKVNPMKYLFYTIKMNKTIEDINKEIRNNKNLTDEEIRCKTKKLFQPISLRKTIIPSYITLDTNVILSIFKNSGESNMNKETKKNKDKIWDKIFRINKRVMKMKDYEYKTIQTDGIGVSICFQKKGKKYKENNKIDDEDNEMYISDLTTEDLEKCKTKKLVSIDPGKKDLVYMVDDNKNKLKYTACQRRIESLSKRCNKIIQTEKIKKGIIEKETILSKYNCKTVNYEEFKKYIIEKTKLNDELRSFYEENLYRKLKWRTCIYRRKSEDKFLNRIKEKFGKNLLLCYGNWSRTKQMKYIMPTKGIGLRRIIRKKYDVVLIDEYKTSKLCSHCGDELENYKNIHRLLVCKNCKSNIKANKSNGSESKKITFMNRDMNACMNMLEISHKWIKFRDRPNKFKRKPLDTCFSNEKILTCIQ